MSARKLTCLACGQTNRVPEARLAEAPKCGTCGAALMPSRPVAVDFATLRKAAKGDDVPLLVDFWAPWCGPCRTMAPEFAKAAQALAGKVRLAKLNTEDQPQAGQAYGIRSIPTMIAFAGGREHKRQSGAVPASAIIGFAAG